MSLLAVKYVRKCFVIINISKPFLYYSEKLKNRALTADHIEHSMQ